MTLLACDPDVFGRDEPCGSAVPRIRPHLSFVELDDGTALYDEIAGSLVMLNPGASSVWERCDGIATLDDVVADISREHGLEETEVRADVWLTLRKLADLGLVATAS